MSKKHATGKTAAPSKAMIAVTASNAGSNAGGAVRSGNGGIRSVDDQARCAMIAERAYFRAEHRGFASGGELDDWLEAEREIEHTLG